jgi:hypothetical protein
MTCLVAVVVGSECPEAAARVHTGINQNKSNGDRTPWQYLLDGQSVAQHSTAQLSEGINRHRID